jgi:hypothetical protein
MTTKQRAARKLEIHIRDNIDGTYVMIEGDFKRLPLSEAFKYECCDGLSKSTATQVPDIARLAELENGLPKPLNLILNLGKKAYLWIEKNCVKKRLL